MPFDMPPGVETFSLSYHYERHHESDAPVDYGRFTSRQEINIIDLGLIDPDGLQVGASGSDKTSIQLSETRATPGYQPWLLKPGEWRIIVGAYKVAPAGVDIRYELSFTPKRLRLFKGDLHLHTLASDGVLTLDELAAHAQRHGLDYLAITDHNQMVTKDALSGRAGLTFIPGLEWTHFQGHANFLGVDKPYDEPFLANSLAEIRSRFDSARQRGALIVINHPFDEVAGFHFDIASLPFDCLEIWNGPMRPSNLQTLALWHSMLQAGQRIPICGGSDYHRDMLFLFAGGPCTCIYAMSDSPADLLQALKAGHAYIVYAPDGPSLSMTAGDALLGDTVPFSQVREIQITASNLLAGDLVQVVTATGAQPLLRAPAPGDFHAVYPVATPGFVRLEILRAFLPGLPLLPALLSNPIYLT